MKITLELTKKQMALCLVMFGPATTNHIRKYDQISEADYSHIENLYADEYATIWNQFVNHISLLDALKICRELRDEICINDKIVIFTDKGIEVECEQIDKETVLKIAERLKKNA